MAETWQNEAIHSTEEGGGERRFFAVRLNDGGVELHTTVGSAGMRWTLDREGARSLAEWMNRPDFGSDHGLWKCGNLACGVVTHCAEWCPGCGCSNRTEAAE